MALARAESLIRLPEPREQDTDRISTSLPGYKLLDFLAKEEGYTVEDVTAKKSTNDSLKQGIVVDFVYLAMTAPEPLSRQEILDVLQRKDLPEYCRVRVKERIRADGSKDTKV